MCIYGFLSITLIISDGEVWIDAFLRDHRKVEVVSFHRLVRINRTQRLNELEDTQRHFTKEICTTHVTKPQTSWEVESHDQSAPISYIRNMTLTESHSTAGYFMNIKRLIVNIIIILLATIHTKFMGILLPPLLCSKSCTSVHHNIHTSPACVPSQIYGW